MLVSGRVGDKNVTQKMDLEFQIREGPFIEGKRLWASAILFEKEVKPFTKEGPPTVLGKIFMVNVGKYTILVGGLKHFSFSPANLGKPSLTGIVFRWVGSTTTYPPKVQHGT